MSWLTDIDPTNPSSGTYGGLSTVFPGFGGTVENMGAQRAADNERERLEEEARARQALYDQLGRDYSNAREDPETIQRGQELADIRGREIDRGLADASRGIQQGYSRRGIGGSGYAAGAQSGAVQAAAAERSRARAAAIDQAVAETQRGLLGEANISNMGDPLLASMLSAAEARYAQIISQAAEARRANEEYWRNEGMDVIGFFTGGAVGGEGGGMGGMMGGGGGGATA